MTSENNSLLLNLQEVDKTTGEVVKLDVNSTSTVQPVALMRLGLFVPTLKSTGKSKANRKNVTDATEELVQLSIAKSEGYTDVKITGSRLDMDTDFKVWLGIIRSMSEYGVKSDTLELSFVEFVKMCGFDSRRSNKKMRDRISNSLFKLASVTLKFQSETKGWTTHLVQSAYYDINEDIVAPISMKRMRDRLNLTSNVYTQNHTVRKAMEQLRDIGYLDYTEFKRGRATYFSVHYRNPKLISGPVKVPRKEEEEKAPEQNYDEVIKALKAAGIDPLKLAEALSAMKPEN